jgi:hypothetical protein
LWLFVDNEETDIVETMLRTAVDVLPLDGDVRARESGWLYERFSAVDGDELYDRYLRLFDRINGTDLNQRRRSRRSVPSRP